MIKEQNDKRDTRGRDKKPVEEGECLFLRDDLTLYDLRRCTFWYLDIVSWIAGDKLRRIDSVAESAPQDGEIQAQCSTGETFFCKPPHPGVEACRREVRKGKAAECGDDMRVDLASVRGQGAGLNIRCADVCQPVLEKDLQGDTFVCDADVAMLPVSEGLRTGFIGFITRGEATSFNDLALAILCPARFESVAPRLPTLAGANFAHTCHLL